MAALEREVGAKLLERDGRGLRPTDAGTAFAPYAAHVLGLLEQGGRAAREAAAGGRAMLRISAVTSAGDHVVPQLIRAFRDAHPELDIDLHIGNRSEVFAGLLDHRADVAITGRVPDDDRLVGEAFAVNEIVLVTAPDDPLAKRRWVAVEELAGRPWLLREPGSGSRAMAEEWLRQRGLVPAVLTLGSNTAVREAARAGLGIGLVSRTSAALELRHGPARHDPPARRAAAAAVVRGAVDGRPAAARRRTRSWRSWRRRRRGRCSTGCWRCASGWWPRASRA